MAKTLEFTIKSPRQIKQGDTETTFTFICKNDGSVVDLTQATSITAKIGNASGYLRSQPIAITSLAGLNPGWLNLQPTPTLISDLPAGDYQLEIWVIDQAGTSIYPSDNPLGFTVTNNIESESGASITTIAFDDFVEAMNKAASTIAKGDKGDVGPQGLNGLTTTSLPNDTDINQLTQPGSYTLWLKLAKNTPMYGSDQGSILLVFGPSKDSDWMAQLLLTFYSGAYYRADSAPTIKAGKTAWKKLTID
ncbi:collagen-like protein [Lactiplantibacillus plantarum]|nr:collagen-like protein [Lactiplantibacillus plantarum]MCG0880366.1 collagen-like protein [Lactiplantibacillus plantarum]